MIAERERNNAQIVELQGKISRGLAAKAKLPQFREEVALLEVQLEKLLKILPPRRDVQDVLRRFRALAEQEDFVLSEFRPGQENQKDFYNEWPITVRLSGTYHNLARFFDRMSRFSRIFNVDNLQISQTRGSQSADDPGVVHRQDLRLPGGRAAAGGEGQGQGRSRRQEEGWLAVSSRWCIFLCVLLLVGGVGSSGVVADEGADGAADCGDRRAGGGRRGRGRRGDAAARGARPRSDRAHVARGRGGAGRLRVRL